MIPSKIEAIAVGVGPRTAPDIAHVAILVALAWGLVVAAGRVRITRHDLM